MISVIIPTYQEPEYLDLCLESIFRTQTYDNQIIVVVDGFMDMNIDVLRKYPKVDVIEFPENQGLSVATNWGVYNSKYEDILVVNDDNVFSNGWDEKLIDKAQSGWVWSANQIEPNPSMFKQFHIHNLGKDPSEFNLDEFIEYTDKMNVDKVDMTGSTLPFFMKRNDYLAVGGWDVMYPSPHVVDWDFFLKCNLAGFQMWRTYNVHFYHFAGAATRKTPEEDEKSTRKELVAHEFAKQKWNSYIYHKESSNLKYIK